MNRINLVNELVEVKGKWIIKDVDMNACLQKYSDSVIKIDYIYVPEKVRERGLGTACIKEIISIAKHYRCDVYIEPSGNMGGDVEALIRWYKRLGFEPEEGSVPEDGMWLYFS